MDESKLYEMIGRKQAEIENRDENYNSLLGVLLGLTMGTIPLDRVTVDLATRSWKIEPPKEAPIAE